MNVSRRAFVRSRIEEVPRVGRATAIAFVCLLACAVSGATPDPFLSTSGINVRNGHGTGDIVPLRGENLGGWLVMEPWMCPMDSSGLVDNYSVISTLDTRFGTNIEQSLIRTYQ